MVLLHESGQIGDVTLVPATGNPIDGGSLPVAETLLGNIPALVCDDGHALHDSRVICRYPDARGGGR